MPPSRLFQGTVNKLLAGQFTAVLNATFQAQKDAYASRVLSSRMVLTGGQYYDLAAPTEAPAGNTLAVQNVSRRGAAVMSYGGPAMSGGGGMAGGIVGMVGAGGDMTKAIYDPDSDGSVEQADNADTLDGHHWDEIPTNGTRLLTGGSVTWLSDYTFNVAAGTGYINGIYVTWFADNVTLVPSDSDTDRLDLIVVRRSDEGRVSPLALTGVPAASPFEPYADPGIYLRLSMVLVAAGSTEPAVSTQLVYAERAAYPTEWLVTCAQSSVDVASADSPHSGSICIKSNGGEAGVTISADGGTDEGRSVLLRDYVYLSLWICPLAPVGDPGLVLRIVPLYQGAAVINQERWATPVYIKDGSYGLDTSSHVWQQVLIPTADFTDIPGARCDQLLILPQVYLQGFRLDDIMWTAAATSIPSSIVLTGSITATSGSIGGWALDASRIYKPNAVLHSDGHVAFGATPPAAFGSNVGAFLGIDSSLAKLSLYADANNYLQWDGAKLLLKSAKTSIDASGYLITTGGTIGGWTIGSTSLANSTSIILSSSGKISFRFNTFGSMPGIQLDYNAGSPRLFVGKDADNFFKLDGNLTWNAAGVSSMSADGTLTTSKLVATGGTIGALTVNNVLRVGASTPYINVDGSNALLQTNNFLADQTGWQIKADGSAEFNNISVRGTLRTVVFERDTISVVGGSLMVLDGDTLAAGIAAGATQITVTAGMIPSANAILRLKDGFNDEWMQVVSSAGGYTLNVTRAVGGVAAAWPAGTPVAKYGQSTAGGLLLTSTLTNAPYISIFTNGSTPWAGITERVRLGNLTGTSNGSGYGLWSDNVFVQGYIDANSGHIGTLDIDGVLSLAAGGGIYQGSSGSFAAPDIGLKIWNNAGVGSIAGYNGGVQQWVADTDGRIKAAGGNIVIGDANYWITFKYSGSDVGRVYASSGGGLFSSNSLVLQGLWPGGGEGLGVILYANSTNQIGISDHGAQIVGGLRLTDNNGIKVGTSAPSAGNWGIERGRQPHDRRDWVL